MLTAQLNKKITIEKGDASINSIGSPVLVWSEFIYPWANVYTPSGDARTPTGEGEEFTYNTVFTIRYNNYTKLITNKYRVLYNNTYYKILRTEEVGVKDSIKLTTIQFYYE